MGQHKGLDNMPRNRGLGISMTLDLSDFNKVIEPYQKFSNRLPSDIVNGKLYFIARNATTTTKAASKAEIESELRGKATNVDAPLAAVIVNSNLKKEGKKGLTGEKMARAVEKLIKKRKQSVNFVRAGWKNAIRIIETYLSNTGELKFVRRGSSKAPVDKETMRKKGFESLGKATPANSNTPGRAWGEIQNNVHGKNGDNNLANLETVKVEGLQEAVNKEVRSMLEYIERKMNPVHKEFNSKQGY